MLGEQLLAAVGIEIDETEARLGEPDVAFRHLGEAQELQHLGDRKEIVDLHLQGAAQRRQVGVPGCGPPPPPPSGRPTGRRTCGSSIEMPVPRKMPCPSAPRLRRDGGVDVVDQLAKGWIRRLRGCGSSTLISAATRPGFDEKTRMRSDIRTASSMLCVARMIEEIGIAPRPTGRAGRCAGSRQ